jgi:predicted nucleotidyltransferase
VTAADTNTEAALHLLPAQRALVSSLLARHLPGTTVRAFGSRVAGWPGSRGVIKPQSDLDLALDLCGRPADLALALALALLRADLDDSDLPWRVDLCLLDELPETLRELIARHGVPL